MNVIYIDYISYDETGSCYKYHSEELQWQQAWLACKLEGAELAVVDSEVEAEVLLDIINDSPKKTTYSHIGFLKLGEEWFTTDGE